MGALGANPQEIVPCPGPGVLVNCAGVSNPSWSPNGQWIAFELVLGPFDPSGNPADDSIWAVRPNGSGLRQITHRTQSGGTNITHSDIWESSPRWGTHVLLP